MLGRQSKSDKLYKNTKKKLENKLPGYIELAEKYDNYVEQNKPELKESGKFDNINVAKFIGLPKKSNKELTQSGKVFFPNDLNAIFVSNPNKVISSKEDFKSGFIKANNSVLTRDFANKNISKDVFEGKKTFEEPELDSIDNINAKLEEVENKEGNVYVKEARESVSKVMKEVLREIENTEKYLEYDVANSMNNIKNSFEKEGGFLDQMYEVFKESKDLHLGYNYDVSGIQVDMASFVTELESLNKVLSSKKVKDKINYNSSDIKNFVDKVENYQMRSHNDIKGAVDLASSIVKNVPEKLDVYKRSFESDKEKYKVELEALGEKRSIGQSGLFSLISTYFKVNRKEKSLNSKIEKIDKALNILDKQSESISESLQSIAKDISKKQININNTTQKMEEQQLRYNSIIEEAEKSISTEYEQHIDNIERMSSKIKDNISSISKQFGLKQKKSLTFDDSRNGTMQSVNSEISTGDSTSIDSGFQDDDQSLMANQDDAMSIELLDGDELWDEPVQEEEYDLEQQSGAIESVVTASNGAAYSSQELQDRREAVPTEITAPFALELQEGRRRLKSNASNISVVDSGFGIEEPNAAVEDVSSSRQEQAQDRAAAESVGRSDPDLEEVLGSALGNIRAAMMEDVDSIEDDVSLDTSFQPQQSNVEALSNDQSQGHVR